MIAGQFLPEFFEFLSQRIGFRLMGLQNLTISLYWRNSPQVEKTTRNTMTSMAAIRIAQPAKGDRELAPMDAGVLLMAGSGEGDAR